MKQFRLILLLVMVALAGCTKTEFAPVPDQEITFSVVSHATATKTSEVTEFTSFKSKGFLHAEGVNSVQDFFGASGETITKDPSTNEWNPTHPYYWPKSEESYINFVSWYDKNGNPTSVTENNITWTNRTIAADDNIVVAKKAWNQKMNVRNYYTPGVPTLFQHKLAHIEFKVKASVASETVGSVTTTWSINVSNFTLTNVYNTGSLSLTSSVEPTVGEGEPCVSEWTGSWVTSGDPSSISGSTVSNIGATPTSVLARRSVIPQALGSKSISFDYTITTTSTNGEETHTLTESFNSGNIALDSFLYADDWQMNKYITYTITVTSKTGAITMTPSVQDIDSSLLLNIE